MIDDRAQAILMASRGRGAAQIAQDLAVHVSTVRRWLAHWRKGGLATLRIQWQPFQGVGPLQFQSSTPDSESVMIGRHVPIAL